MLKIILVFFFSFNIFAQNYERVTTQDFALIGTKNKISNKGIMMEKGDGTQAYLRANFANSTFEQSFDGTLWSGLTGGGSAAITSDRTIFVATTGNDTTGDGQVGTPFATPQKALAYLNGFSIASGVTVTISCAAGVYNLTSPIIPQHPFGQQIEILGATVSAPPTFANFAITGNSPAQRNADSITNLAMLKSKYPTQFSFPNNMDGIVLQATSIKLRNILLYSTFKSVDNVTTSGWGIRVGTTNAVPPKITFGGSLLLDTVSVHGFALAGAGVSGKAAINVTGTPAFTLTGNGSSGLLAEAGGNVLITVPLVADGNGSDAIVVVDTGHVAVNGTLNAQANGGGGIYVLYNGSMFAASTVNTSTNAGRGVYVAKQSSLMIQDTLTTSNNSGSGIDVLYMSRISIGNSTVSNSNQGTGIRVGYLSNAELYNFSSTACIGGINATDGSGITIWGNVSTTNSTGGATNGIEIYNGSTMTVNGGTVTSTGNGSQGISVQHGSRFFCIYSMNTTTATGNASGGLYAGYGSFIRMAPGTIQSYSPALNTLGNQNSYISN